MRYLDLARGDGDEREAAERGEQLDLGERDRVVARRVALHQDDLERVRGRAGEHERIADGVTGAHSGQQAETDEREPDAQPDHSADARPEEEEREERGEDDVEPGDEAGARDRRPLEPRGLEPVARREQEAEPDPGDRAAAAERAHAPGGRHGEHEARDREPHGKEREQRIDRDRVLDLHEREPPDGRDADEGEQRRVGAIQHRARLSPRSETDVS